MQRLAAISVAWALCGGCTCEGTAAPEPLIVPYETADADALARASDWRGLPVFAPGAYRMQSSEDRKTGERQQIALWEHDNRDFNNFVCRGEQTEAPPSRVPHVVDLPACPEPHVRGMVMARFEGSGRLARLWLTAASIRNAPPDDEIVRIYVDDRTEPLIQAPLGAMLGGGGHPIFAPPFGAGSRRYVAWRYPVVFSKKLILTLDRLGDRDLYFHQTTVVLDEVPTARVPRGLGRERVRELLTSGVPDAATVHSFDVALAPGERREITERGPATIVNATVRAPTLAMLSEVRVTAHWDGAAEAAIDLPLAELFAMWDAPPERASLALAAHGDGDGVTAKLRLPMPFEREARWSLENRGHDEVRFGWLLEVAPRIPARAFGRLHVQRNETSKGAEKGYHPLAAVSGRGRLVGTCVALRGHGMRAANGRAGHPYHFLEGDEIGLVDGERALAGTGTEDYFDGAFYFEDGARGTPFAQVWDITPSIPDAPHQARVSTCRWHVLTDAVDFRESLDLKLEVGPGTPDVLDHYRSVTFIYR